MENYFSDKNHGEKHANKYLSLLILAKEWRKKKFMQCFWNYQQTKTFSINFQQNVPGFSRKKTQVHGFNFPS